VIGQFYVRPLTPTMSCPIKGERNAVRGLTLLSPSFGCVSGCDVHEALPLWGIWTGGWCEVLNQRRVLRIGCQEQIGDGVRRGGDLSAAGTAYQRGTAEACAGRAKAVVGPRTPRERTSWRQDDRLFCWAQRASYQV
jgi:hypothetical protein